MPYFTCLFNQKWLKIISAICNFFPQKQQAAEAIVSGT